MLLLRLWNYTRGYVIIVVEGYFLEKFINICIHRQVFLWGIKRQKDCTMRLNVSIRGFKMLRPIAKKTGCRVEIVEKKGLPFVLNRYKHRKTFVAGAFAFIILFYIFTSFIWAIEVTGNEKIDTGVLIDKLAEYGVKQGGLKYSIDTGDVVSSLMIDVKELAWVGVSIKGTKVKVRVVERVAPPELIPSAEPCNIIAYRDAVIKSVYAKIGQQEVKAGDTVKRGQLLISGSVTSENKEVGTKLVHASGEVFATTWYEGSAAVRDVIEEKASTGEKMSNYTLVLFSKEFKLFHKTVPYNEYEKEEIKKRISVGEDMVLPIGIIVDTYNENKLVKKNIGLEEAQKAAEDEAYDKASEDIPEEAEIVKRDVQVIEKEDGGMEVNVMVECIEDIGIEQKIGGS